jgi:hypothetical protein
MKIKVFALVLLALVLGCSKGGDNVAQKPAAQTASEDPLKGLKLPSGLEPQNKDAQSGQYGLPEGSGGAADDHPNPAPADKVERDVLVPETIKGKWKAVKLQVTNKAKGNAVEMKTAELGSIFTLENADTKLKVTVGVFLPNFVMSQTSYTSVDNQLNNPAVQLTVEENGKVLYKGWTFAKYPTLYAFEHKVFGFQLMDFVPAS